MTKEEVLQRANDYCNERSYDNATLTDEFKDKFADFFAKKHESANIDDDGILDEIKFNLDTAKSAVSRGIASKQKSFESKESDYIKQIDELKKKVTKKDEKKDLEIPKELQDQLDELKMFKNNQAKQEKFANIINLAKQTIRQDLHKSFESYAKDYQVDLNIADDEQAKRLTARFQEIFKDSIGDIKPLAPQQKQKQEEELINSLPKIKVC